MGSPRRAAWHPDPDTSPSPYIGAQARSLREAGWIIEPLRLHHFRESDTVVHIHWPEHLARSTSRSASVVKPAFVAAVLGLLRLRRRAAVVWTVHNLRPHRPAENRLERALESSLFSSLAQRADLLISLVAANEQVIRDTFDVPESTPVRHVPEGVAEPSDPVLKGASAPVRLLSLGSLLDYKDLPGLAAVASKLTSGELKLHIAGSPLDPSVAESLMSGTQANNVEVSARRIPDDEVADLLEVTDAIVVTHREQFNSGAPFWALANGLPVVTVASNLSAELLASVGASWVYELPVGFDADDLRDAAQWVSKDRQAMVLDAHAWQGVSERLGAAYEEALARRSMA